MKFCYLDESGVGNEPLVVCVGVVVDALRMHRTKHEWGKLLKEFSKKTKVPVSEIHTTNLYRGNDEWRSVKGTERAEMIDQILDWLTERKHKIMFSAVDKQKFSERLPHSSICSELKTPLQSAFFHIVLGIQKKHQSEKNNKGHTVLVFDRGKLDLDLPQLLYDPPSWSDSYYGHKSKKDRLDQIVDVPFFADSKQAPLIQIADFVAYFLRLHAELTHYGHPGKYEDEREKVENWVSKIKKICYPTSNRYLGKGRCTVAEEFFDLCPESLRKL